MEVLAEVAGSLSPFVECTGAGICTEDARTVRVHDWSAWARVAVDRLAALELRALAGVAQNADLALLAARRGSPVLVVQDSLRFLSSLVIAEVEPPPELLAVLEDWGIRNLGEFTQLAKSDVLDRLGASAGDLWQCATGQNQRLLRLVRPPAVYAETFDFEHEVATTEPLLFILRRLLDSLVLRLREAGRVASRMLLTLPLEGGALYERQFSIPAPTADVDVLHRILATHLEALRLDHGPTGLRLHLEPALPAGEQLQLFEAALRDPNRFGETLARLAALVGGDNVGVPLAGDTHRPDQFRLSEPRWKSSAGEPAGTDAAIGLPLRRYRPPFPAQVQVVRHRPAYLVSERVQGAVSAVLGPYRLSGQWWDEACWHSEEWDVEIPRHGLFRVSQGAQEEWFVEGSYDE